MITRRPTNQEIHDIIKSSCEFINESRNKRLAFIKNSKIIQSVFPDDEYEIKIRTKEGLYRIGYIWKMDSRGSHEFKFQDCGIFF